MVLYSMTSKADIGLIRGQIEENLKFIDRLRVRIHKFITKDQIRKVTKL